MTHLLNLPQRRALLSVPDETNHRLITGHGQTLRALERRGLCTNIIAFRDGTFAILTDAGMAEVVTLTCP